MKARQGPHFHVSLFMDGEMFYDYNSFYPSKPIEQFAAAIEGVVYDADHEQICDYVIERFAENEQVVMEDENYSISLGDTNLGASVAKCWGTCLVSPSMN